MLRFLDCEIGVGGTGMSLPTITDPSKLLAVMDRYAIEKALVYDRGAHESGVFDRFDFILDFCRRSDRLLPTIPILPPATGEQPPPKELVGMILASGIKAVRACPGAHHFIFDAFAMGTLLEELELHAVPILHTSMHLQDHSWAHEPAWRDIREVAKAFPRLPIVVLYTGMLQGRRLLPLLEGCSNVLADLTCMSFQFVQFVTERLGSKRLVMASHLPCEDPGIYTTWVNYCGLDEEARRDIASGNMLRLLEAVR